MQAVGDMIVTPKVACYSSSRGMFTLLKEERRMSLWPEELMNNWSDAQKRYWNAWAELAKMGQPESKPAEQSEPMWGQGLDQWWNAVSQYATPGPTKEVFQRTVAMGKTYMSLAESLFNVQGSKLQDMEAVDAWIRNLESSFRHWQAQLDAGKFTVHEFGMGQSVIDGWQRVLKSLGVQVPEGMGNGLQMPISSHWQEHINKLLSTPAVGMNRETQQRWQQLLKLMTNYQESANDYLQAFAKQGLSSVAVLRERINVLRDKGENIKTLRQLYDLWVEVNEESYSKFAMTADYQSVYGEMVNNLVALKQGINAELEEQYRSANIPTRSELKAAYKSQMELRRENRALRQQLQDLTRKVDALTALMENRSSSVVAKEKGTPAAKKPSKPKAKTVSEVAMPAIETSTMIAPAADEVEAASVDPMTAEKQQKAKKPARARSQKA